MNNKINVFGVVLMISILLSGCVQKEDENAYIMPEELPVQENVTEEPAKEVPEQKKEPATIEVRSLYDGRYKMIITEDMQKWIEEKWYEDSSLPVPEPEERNWDLLAGKEAEKQALKIGADEDVILKEIFDFPVCDYIEVEYETFDAEHKLRSYTAIYDRSGELKASCRSDTTERYYEDSEFCRSMWYSAISTPFEPLYAPLYRMPAKVYKNIGEMEEMKMSGWAYLEDENEIICKKGDYQEDSPADDYILNEERRETDDTELNITVRWYCHYTEVVNVPYAKKINKRIREYMEERQQSWLKDEKNNFVMNTEIQEGDNALYSLSHDSKLFYRDASYIAVSGSGYCKPVETPPWLVEEEKWMLCFDLKTGEEVKAEDFLGKGCGFEELKNAAWIGYQKLMEEEPDKYTKRAFDDYYEKVPEDKITYYFSEEGMVFYYYYYDVDYRKPWEDLPVEYKLDEHMGVEFRMDLVVPYEDLK